MVCAVCARVLNWIRTPDGQVDWIHPFDLDEDHPVVPVSREQIHVEGRCDFCLAPDPQFSLPVRPFQNQLSIWVPVDVGTDAGWAACADCARLIDLGQWSAVTKRAVADWERRHGPMPPPLLTQMKALHRQVRKNATGASRPIDS